MDLKLSGTEFKVLSSDTRRKILRLLSERNHNITEVSQKLGIAMPTAKEHLELLKQAGLVEVADEQRKWKYYRLTRKGSELVSMRDNTTILVMICIVIFGILAIGAFILPQMSFQKTYSKNCAIDQTCNVVPMQISKTPLKESVEPKNVLPTPTESSTENPPTNYYLIAFYVATLAFLIAITSLMIARARQKKA